MLYQIYETQRSIMEPFADLAQAAAKMYSNPLNPMGNSPLAQRVSASYELMHRLGKDYVKPEFGIRTVKVGKVDVAIHERVEIDKAFCELRRFKRFSDDAPTLNCCATPSKPCSKTTRSTSPIGKMPAWCLWLMANSTWMIM
jgi:poly(3-hydroxybutyrate) depolymerase